MLWRAETDGKDFSTPERRAGLERSLGEIVAAIGDGKIADYYRRDFDQRVFEAFKRRPAPPVHAPPAPEATRPGARRPEWCRARPHAGAARRSRPAVKASLLARAGRPGAAMLKEMELAALLLEAAGARPGAWRAPGGLPFSDPFA